MGYRSSRLSTASSNSITVLFPADAAVGDLLVVFVMSHYGYIAPTTPPTGWTMVDYYDPGPWVAGRVFAKVATSGDISAGSVVSTGMWGSEPISAVCYAITDAVVADVSVLYTFGNVNPGGTSFSSGDLGARDTDSTYLYLVGGRPGLTLAIDQGTVAQSRATDTSVLAKYEEPSSTSPNLTVGFTLSANNGCYGAVLKVNESIVPATARLSREHVEALTGTDPDSRSSRSHVEALTSTDPDSRSSSLHVEALTVTDPDSYISRAHIEVLVRQQARTVKYVGAPAGVLKMKHPDDNWRGVTWRGGYSGEVLADNPLAYYRLGESSGASPLADSSPNGRHGVWNGSPVLGSPGLIRYDSNTCFSPNGNTANKGQIASATWMDVPTITLECWVQFTSSLSSQMMIERDNQSSAPRPFQFRVNGSRANIILNGGGANLQTNATLSLGAWYHLVATHDGVNTRIYVNGALDNTVAYATPIAAAVRDIYIGSGGSLWPMSGRIDEVAIYSGALSGTRIAAHYAAGI